MRLSDLPNIGKMLEQQLNDIGINNYDQLVIEGSVNVAKRLASNVDV